MLDDIVDLLREGDKRTVKNVATVVGVLERNPSLLPQVLCLLEDGDEPTAMRAADCLEKLSRSHPLLLQPHLRRLLDILTKNSQQEVHWHMAQILPRLALSRNDFETASEVWLDDFYTSSSRIVQVESLQALFEIRQDFPQVLPRLYRALDQATKTGSAAVKSRATRLTRQLENKPGQD